MEKLIQITRLLENIKSEIAQLEELLYPADMIVVSAWKQSVEFFLDKQIWYPPVVKKSRRPELKWIALYERLPVQAITHLARINSIEPYNKRPRKGEVLIRTAKPVELSPLPLGTIHKAVEQYFYTWKSKLDTARTMDDLHLGRKKTA